MPTYEYRCGKCGRHFDVYQSFSETPLTKHPECGGKVTKVLSPAGIVLKGSGFYKTDSRRGRGKHKEHTDTSSEKSEKSDKTAAASSSEKTSDGGAKGASSDSSSSSGSSGSSKGEAKSA